ncbi:hypothetical protein HK104_001243, partial [Borealophlyctis nickersoniae]
MSCLLSLSLLSLAIPTVYSACECGYIDSFNRAWRETIESEFTATTNFNAAPLNSQWSVQTWSGGGGPIPRIHTAENVMPYNGALGMKVSAYSDPSRTQPIRVSEIATFRNDILFGSFRSVYAAPDVPGICVGFFTYTSGTAELDVEILTADGPATIWYTAQPPSDGSSFKKVISGLNNRAFHEHRIDWVSGTSEFFIDKVRQQTIVKNVPNVGATVLFNAWSNGDPQWSGGPPTQDAIATVRNIRMYFNSTSFSHDAFINRCNAAGGSGKASTVCRVDAADYVPGKGNSAAATTTTKPPVTTTTTKTITTTKTATPPQPTSNPSLGPCNDANFGAWA